MNIHTRLALLTGTMWLFGPCAFAEDAKPPCCRELSASTPFTDRSIYQLESDWTSDIGREIRLGVFRGHLQVVAMFFTTCESSCPIIVDDMKHMEKALPEKLRGNVDFLLVSFDSERDTPEVLHAYREKMHLSTEHWTLLRGAPDEVRELAAILGVNFQKDARGQFMHSNLITVLNTEGEVVHQQAGIRSELQPIIAALEHATQGKP
ncbi:electron transport protein SCO1/SenC [Chthoniobacter flavus Ellin428]|uniref:Electron transport protein SCO1/SenC n=1 Tax=Chthoniobacter flavus Ellin428 TaxID=497964 RepID=B4D2V4_9BACT|nr:SCO family protein [Chthoniobacter flavus]EDY19065.1 electron transport protein SCO1/SenC [Chthoniobacter flavus Ellin428]TCO86828.1 protein SCO1/2 [Chthoniobacter flavus]